MCAQCSIKPGNLSARAAVPRELGPGGTRAHLPEVKAKNLNYDHELARQSQNTNQNGAASAFEMCVCYFIPAPKVPAPSVPKKNAYRNHILSYVCLDLIHDCVLQATARGDAAVAAGRKTGAPPTQSSWWHHTNDVRQSCVPVACTCAHAGTGVHTCTSTNDR